MAPTYKTRTIVGSHEGEVVVDAECDAELSECDAVECDDPVEVWDCDPDEDEEDEDLGYWGGP
jgi:hypothetical protein